MQKTIETITRTGVFNDWYQYKVIMTDGSVVAGSSKVDPPNYFSEGDLVEMEQKWKAKDNARAGLMEYKFTRIKGSGSPSGGGSSYSAPKSGGFRGGNDGVGQCVGASSKNATDLICSGKIPFDGSCTHFLGITKKIAVGLLAIQNELGGASAPPAAPQAPQQPPAASQAQPPQEPSYDPPANDIPVDDDDTPF